MPDAPDDALPEWPNGVNYTEAEWADTACELLRRCVPMLKHDVMADDFRVVCIQGCAACALIARIEEMDR